MAMVVAAWAIVVSSPAVHADQGWVISSFHSDVTVAQDSTLTVKEDIRVGLRLASEARRLPDHPAPISL